MSIFYDAPGDSYSVALANQNRHLDEQIAGIRARQEAGTISIREAADERIRVMTDHLAALHALRRKHFGDGR
jgi:hypothetical protein